MTKSIYALSKDQGPAVWFLGTLTTVKAAGKQNGGAFGLVEQILPPGWASPYHVHRNDDEAFWILEGEATFFSGDARLELGPGSYIYLPRDIPHGFRVRRAPSRILVLTAPAGFEDFVLEAGEPARTRTLPPPPPAPPDLEHLTRLAARYGIEILGPLPE